MNLMKEFFQFDFMDRNQECEQADWKYFCGSAIVPGEKQVIEIRHLVLLRFEFLFFYSKDGSVGLYLPDLYVPQRASRTICQDFINKCQSISYQMTTFAAHTMGLNFMLSPWEAYKHCE